MLYFLYQVVCTYQRNLRLSLIWDEVGICITENYNSPPTGEVLAMQTPGILELGRDLYSCVALV